MASPNAAKPVPATTGNRLQIDRQGSAIDRSNSPNLSGIQALRAELIGADTCTALGITTHGSAPVLMLCRNLIEVGHDPATPLEVYRGATLALRVRSIGEGAALTVEDNRLGRPTFRRWRERARSDGAALPARQTALAAISAPAAAAAQQ